MVVTLRGGDGPDERAAYRAVAVPATPGYFRALGVRLERGRLFTDSDDALAPPVVILSADTAHRLFDGEDPLGRTIRLPSMRDGHTISAEMTVVGITANVKYSGLDQMADDLVYRPFAQQAHRSVFLVARTTGDPAVLAAQLRPAIAAVDPAIVVADVATLDDVLADVTSSPRFRTFVLAGFAAMALLIAGVGLYGVIAYSVSQRTGEIGIRMTLGADGRRIRTMVLRDGLTLALVGAATGAAAAWSLTSLLGHLLYGIAPTDPASFALAAGGMAAACLISSYVPAARAARTDPLVVLKEE
jgi:putative ABC transport system permease protein